MIFSARKKIYLRCYESISIYFNEVCHSQKLATNNDDKALTGSSGNDSEDYSSLPSLKEQLYNQKEAKEELNSGLQLLEMETVRDELVCPSK